MENGFKRILLATDGSRAAKAAEQSAFKLANRDQATVIIADSIRRQSRMEKWLVKNSEEMFQLLENDKTARLDELAKEFSALGVEATAVPLLHGKSSEQLVRTVIEKDCDLLVRYLKGSDSRQRGLFGTTALNLLRDCPCPVLLVKENQAVENPKVLACVDTHDGDQVNDVILREAARIRGTDLSDVGVLFCWIIFGHNMVRSQMSPENYEKMFKKIRQEHENEYDQLLEKHGLDRSMPNVAMEFGHPEHVIGPFVSENKVDITVMSTVSTAAVNRFLGSTIENVLRDLPSNLLAVKPVDFESPY